MGKTLDIRGLTFSFPGRRLFDGVTFTATGAALCCGGNGTGKTTLLRIVSGLLPPVGGTLMLDKKSTWRTSVFLDASMLFEEETVGQHLKWFGVMSGETLDADELGVAADMPVRALSSGKKQLLALRLVCAMPCDMIVADEPFAHLDDSAERLVVQWLERALSSGRFVLMASPHKPSLPFEAAVWAL